jgi:hypothetical protein
MTNAGELPKLIYPHEAVGTLRDNTHGAQNAAYELAHFAGFLRLQRFHVLSPASRSWAFNVANGEIGADIFPNKSRFNNLVTELGYNAPRSITVEPKELEDGVDYSSQVSALDEDRPQRFCKPVNASRGRGARLADTTEEALAFVAEQAEPYLVQTYEKPERDWRYILHRDSTQLASGEQTAWRVAFKVVQPTVIGDGNKSIGMLVAEDEHMPAYAKEGYTRYYQDTLGTVPPKNKIVQLVQTGNRERGAYGESHSSVEESNLDQFMAQFVHDLEARLHTTLATLCVDIGVKDGSVLSGPYDFEAIKDNIVFYEHQMPFGMKPYLHAIPPETSWGPADKLVIPSRRQEYVAGQIYTSLIRSVIRSGRFLRQQKA